jgi:hypothetical protein
MQLALPLVCQSIDCCYSVHGSEPLNLKNWWCLWHAHVIHSSALIWILPTVDQSTRHIVMIVHACSAFLCVCVCVVIGFIAHWPDHKRDPQVLMQCVCCFGSLPLA